MRYFGHPIRVVDATTLRRLLSNITCSNPMALSDQADAICQMAQRKYNREVRIRKRIFFWWYYATSFHPSPSFSPNQLLRCTPLLEYCIYGGRTFARQRAGWGIRLAAMMYYGGVPAIVLWTVTRKAFIFVENALAHWELIKILNRQDDPFATWRRHCGGDAIIKSILLQDDVGDSTATLPERVIFADRVLGVYGTHYSIRVKLHLDTTHPIWDIIRTTGAEISKPPENIAWECI